MQRSHILNSTHKIHTRKPMIRDFYVIDHIKYAHSVQTIGIPSDGMAKLTKKGGKYSHQSYAQPKAIFYYSTRVT